MRTTERPVQMQTLGGAEPPTAARTVLLTGASGYVGGRLLPRLQAMGLRVRCLARRPGFLCDGSATPPEVVAGDVLDRASLERALAAVETAYYLVHSMGSGADFEAEESAGARNFAAAAKAQGVRRIIYLGGLGGEGARLSAHLRSRHEVGRILRESGVPTIELRASIVIGSGSLSYEMIRALVERLPVMITPRWVRVVAQPIGIEDLVAYLLAALDLPGAESRVMDLVGVSGRRVEDELDITEVRHLQESLDSRRGGGHPQACGPGQAVGTGVDADHGRELQWAVAAQDLDHQVGADVAGSDDGNRPD